MTGTAEGPLRRVLIIASTFPPAAAGGTQRLLRACKYLPGLGWQTIGVAHRRRSPREEDTIANTLVVRTPILRPLAALERMARLVPILRQRRHTYSISAFRVSGPGPYRDMAASTHALLRAALATPDDRVGWVPFGVLAGLRLLSSKGVDAILSTAPPFSSHLIGLALHRLSGLPWVAEFRDPWVENPWHEDWSRVERVANQLLERRVVSRADAVIVTCEQARDQLLASYPDLPADRFHVIPNGFDPEWYALSGTCAASVKTGGGFCLVHCGALYGERDPRPFLTALAAARAHGLDVRFRQAGPAGSFGGLTLAELTAANGLTGYVHHIHRITHRDSLRLQRRADALVLFQSNAPAQVPSKLYEYLGWQKPVLALISNSAATYEVARASGLCMIADARAPAEIELALAGLVRNGATRLLPNLDYLSQFAEPSPSGLLAACLEAVLHGGAHLGAAVRSGPAKTAGEDASGLQLRMQRCNSQLNQTQEAVVPGSPPAVCARRGLCDES